MYTIFLEYANGIIQEGQTYATAEECWKRIDKVLAETPSLESMISFQVVENRG